MTMRELDRLRSIQSVVDGRLMPGRAAERLGLSLRQVERLCYRYRAEAPRVWFHADAGARAITSCRKAG